MRCWLKQEVRFGSYGREVRQEREFERSRFYIESNPVRAGLAHDACQYRWSSAGWATGGSPADEGPPVANNL